MKNILCFDFSYSISLLNCIYRYLLTIRQNHYLYIVRTNMKELRRNLLRWVILSLGSFCAVGRFVPWVVLCRGSFCAVVRFAWVVLRGLFCAVGRFAWVGLCRGSI